MESDNFERRRGIIILVNPAAHAAAAVTVIVLHRPDDSMTQVNRAGRPVRLRLPTRRCSRSVLTP
jgi:hypothetical protein